MIRKTTQSKIVTQKKRAQRKMKRIVMRLVRARAKTKAVVENLNSYLYPFLL